MTVTAPANENTDQKMVTCTIDGIEVSVPENTLIIRAAEQIGIAIPRFCDHPLLDPVGACRQCLVEVPDMGNGKPMPKPTASCTTTVMPGMVVRTQLTSPVADKAQRGVMELLLMNHPLDCPICDKGGECPLQNQAMSNGQAETRFDGPKRTYPKPIPISPQVLLDRERCVLCARCTRFSEQIAGDPFIDLLERGAAEQVGIAEGADGAHGFSSYFSGNTIQICPVGALTSTQYRFRSRPFDLKSRAFTCEHCASGCALRVDVRRGKVQRRQAAVNMNVNEEWNCDKGRWAFQYAAAPDRLTTPLVRDADGVLRAASWPEALAAAAKGLREAAAAGGVGVLPGGRLAFEDSYAYSKFARVVLGTNDVDFRWRAHSVAEQRFLSSRIVGSGVSWADPMRPYGVNYADLEAATSVLLVGFEPEEESPMVFLRLRKATQRRNPLRVFTVAPLSSLGSRKLNAQLIPAMPGHEAGALVGLVHASGEGQDVTNQAATALRSGGAIILVGERAATMPGVYDALPHLAEQTGARLSWVPRRSGERGALEAGLLPNLLPGGRSVNDAPARGHIAGVWDAMGLPESVGRDTTAMLEAARSGELGGLLIAGVDLDDAPDPQLARLAVESVGFVVSLELRASSVTEHADVVFPVASAMEKAGTTLNWEGRVLAFHQVLDEATTMTDARVLHALAAELGVDLRLADVSAIQQELATQIGVACSSDIGELPDRGETHPIDPGHLGAGEAILASWSVLLDDGSLQDGEPVLAATARPVVAHVSPATAESAGVVDGGLVSLVTDTGSLTLPVQVVEMADRVVWVPATSPGCRVRVQLGVGPAAAVRLVPTGPVAATTTPTQTLPNPEFPPAAPDSEVSA